MSKLTVRWLERQTDKKPGRQTCRGPGRQTESQNVTQTKRQTRRERGSVIERQTGRDRQTGQIKERLKDGHKSSSIQKLISTWTERQTDRK